MISEVRDMIEFLEACDEMVGQEGPFYFYPNIQDPPPHDKFAIGEIGRAVTWDDILATFKAVANNRNLGTHFYGQGRIIFDGFRLRGRTLSISWGS